MITPLLLLHGALGASDIFASLIPLLQDHFEIHTLDFEGHGTSPLPARPFRIEHFAENTHDYLRQHNLESVSIFGYSMGGYVACLLAKTNPKLVSGIVTLGTKFYWNNEVAEHETKFLDIEKIKAKVPQFAYALKERHTGAGWENVVNYTCEMLGDLGKRGGVISADDLASLDQRVKIMIGDRDTTVTFDESLTSYRALKHGAFEVFPATPHPLEKVSMERLAFGLREFFLLQS